MTGRILLIPTNNFGPKNMTIKKIVRSKDQQACYDKELLKKDEEFHKSNAYLSAWNSYNEAAALYSQKAFDKAKEKIDESIRLANDVDSESLTADEKFNKSLIDIGLGHPGFSKIYFLAGQIYAVLDDLAKSLEYYKIHQYYNSFLRSEFKTENVNAFTFRRISAHSLYDLLTGSITVSPSWKMNDPFDSVINFWKDKKNLLRTCKECKHIDTYRQSFDYYRIRSFCLENEISPVENILMWSHYADEHKGFCVKYKLSKHFICQEENSDYEHMYLKEIIYRGEKIDICTKSIDTDLAFATKKDDWSYEKEMRLIVYNPNKDEPYYQIKLDNASAVEAIFFGFRCSKSDKDGIKAIFANRGGEMPKFYEMYHDPDDIYKLKYRPV